MLERERKCREGQQRKRKGSHVMARLHFAEISQFRPSKPSSISAVSILTHNTLDKLCASTSDNSSPDILDELLPTSLPRLDSYPSLPSCLSTSDNSSPDIVDELFSPPALIHKRLSFLTLLFLLLLFPNYLTQTSPSTLLVYFF